MTITLKDKQKSGKPIRNLVARPSKRTLQYTSGHTAAATPSILIQLRTERIGLAHYLWRISRRVNPYCECRVSGSTATSGHRMPQSNLAAAAQTQQNDQDSRLRLSFHKCCMLARLESSLGLPERYCVAWLMPSRGNVQKYRHGSLQEAAEGRVAAGTVEPQRSETGSVVSQADIMDDDRARSTAETIIERVTMDHILPRLDRDHEEGLIAEVVNKPSLVVSILLHEASEEVADQLLQMEGRTHSESILKELPATLKLRETGNVDPSTTINSKR